ncbi:MAG: hypothetical protein H5T33_02770 [Candidatus Methanosuratus sp.]|nr:hypothetical protein [Candidatus Methanosuratincola sp.]
MDHPDVLSKSLGRGRPMKNRGREIMLPAELGFSREQMARDTGLKSSLPNNVLKNTKDKSKYGNLSFFVMEE